MTLTFDLVTPKSIGVLYPIWTFILWSLNIVGQLELKLCSGNCFRYQGNSDLDLWPCDPKIINGLLPNMDNYPMKFEHCGSNGWSGNLIANGRTDVQTGGRTDRQTDARGYNIICPFGHIKWPISGLHVWTLYFARFHT
jgi:hypothetical protein